MTALDLIKFSENLKTIKESTGERTIQKNVQRLSIKRKFERKFLVVS